MALTTILDRHNKMTKETIFSLSDEKRELLDLLFWSDDQDIIIRLNEIDGKIQRKLEYCADLLVETRAIIAVRKAALDEAKKRLERNLKQAERAEEHLKSFIKDGMELSGLTKIQGDLTKITLVTTHDVGFSPEFDYEQLPPLCFKPMPKLKDLMVMVEAKRYAKAHPEMDGLVDVTRTSIRES